MRGCKCGVLPEKRLIFLHGTERVRRKEEARRRRCCQVGVREQVLLLSNLCLSFRMMVVGCGEPGKGGCNKGLRV